MLQYWDEKPHVIAASGEDFGFDWHQELRRDPRFTELLIAEHDGRAIGMVQIIDPAQEETHYWGDVCENLRAIDIWIGEEADLNRGFGTQMMRLALQRCFAPENVEAVLIDPLASNVKAHRFYRRFGFRELGPRRFGQDDCLVFRLRRAGWTAYLEGR